MIQSPSIRQLGRGGIALVAAALASAIAAPTRAAQIISFEPVPISPGQPELVFYNAGGGAGTSSLGSGLGSASSGDGMAPVASQGTPGLQIQTPLFVPLPGPRGGVNTAGGTTFYDSSLTLSGLFDTGPATVTALGGGLNLLSQTLGAGGFSVKSTSDVTSNGVADLLSGTVTSAVITGLQGSTSAATLSASVTYTSGMIYDALIAAGGSTSGEFQLTLQLSPPLGVNGTNGRLAAFTAEINGQFNVSSLPEPTMLGLALLGIPLLLRRPRA